MNTFSNRPLSCSLHWSCSLYRITIMNADNHFANRNPTILFFQPRFGNIDINGRKSRWLQHGKGLYTESLQKWDKTIQTSLTLVLFQSHNGLFIQKGNLCVVKGLLDQVYTCTQAIDRSRRASAGRRHALRATAGVSLCLVLCTKTREKKRFHFHFL